MFVSQDDEIGQRKKTDEPTPDVDDADEGEESSATEQDNEPPNLVNEPEPNIQQANQSSPRKRTKADLEVDVLLMFSCKHTLYLRKCSPFCFCNSFLNCNTIQIIFGRHTADEIWYMAVLKIFVVSSRRKNDTHFSLIFNVKILTSYFRHFCDDDTVIEVVFFSPLIDA